MKYHRLHSLLLVFVFSFVLLISGCVNTAPDKTEASAEATVEETNPLATIDPLALNDTLSEEILERMFLPLDKVPLVAIDLDELAQQNSVIKEPASGTVDASVAMSSQKAYLSARWLLTSADDRNRVSNCKKAIEILEKAVKQDPFNASLYQLLGSATYTVGVTDMSVQSSARSIQLQPDNMDAWMVIANVMMNQNNIPKATAAFMQTIESSQATRSNPLTAVAHLQLAGMLQQQGYYMAAARQFNLAYQLIAVQRSYAQSSPVTMHLIAQAHMPLLAQADIYLALGQLDKCIDVIYLAEELLATDDDIVRLFVMSQAKQNLPLQQRYDRVMYLCRYLLSSADQPELVLNLFYDASTEMSKYQSYLELIKQWYEQPPEGVPILSARLYAYGLTLAEQDALAVEMLNLADPKDDPLVYRDRGRLAFKNLQWMQMIQNYASYINVEPSQLDAILDEIDETLALSLDDQELSKWLEGQTIFKQPVAALIAGLLAEGLELPELTEAFYQQALDFKDEAGNAPGRIRLVRFLLKQKRYDDVLTYVQENGASNELLSLAGQAAMELNKLDLAVQYYQDVIVNDAGGLDTYLALGKIYYRQKKFNQAETIFLQIINQWPDNQQVYYQLLALYATWSDQPDLDTSFQQMLDHRGEEMYKTCLAYDDEDATEKLHAQQVLTLLEGLSRDYPKGVQIGMLLSQAYQYLDQMDQATQEMLRLLEYHPENIQAIERLARLYERQMDFDSAATWRIKHWRLDQESPETLRLAMLVLRFAGKADQALELFKEAYAQPDWQFNAEHFAVLREEVLSNYMATREYEDALAFFQGWVDHCNAMQDADEGDVAEEPVEQAEDAETHDSVFCMHLLESLTWAQMQCEQFDEAIQTAHMLYENYAPENDDVSVWLLRSLNIRMMYSSSLELVTPLLEKSDNDDIRILYYITLYDMGKRDEVIPQIKEWYREDPANKRRLRIAYVVLNYINALGDSAEVINEYLALVPQDVGAQIQLANVLINDNQFVKLEELLEDHKTVNQSNLEWLDIWIKYDILRGRCQDSINRVDNLAGPNNKSPQILKLKSQILDNCGQTDAALDLLQTVITKDPCDAEARVQMSILYDKLNEDDLCIKQLNIVFEQEPDNIGVMNNLGFSLVEMGREIDRAYTLLSDSLKVSPNAAPTLDSLGWYYYRDGQFDKALTYIYQSAALMGLPDPEILEHLGDTVYRLDQPEKAEIYWQQASEQLNKETRANPRLLDSRDRVQKKLDQLNADEPVSVAPLFNE